MTTTTHLLDRFKAEKGLASDTAAARALGLSRQAISSYRHGLRHAEPEVIRKLALALGEDADVHVLNVQAERETIPERRKVWLRCAERLSKTAAVIIALVVWTSIHPNDAKAAPDARLTISEQVMHMHRFLETLLRWIAGRFTKTGATPCNLIARPA